MIDGNRDKFLRPSDVANYFDVSQRTVYRWIKDGKLSALRVGNVLRISASEIERLALTATQVDA